MAHRNNFDLLRLFAAFQVVFMHAEEHLKLPAAFDYTKILWSFPGVACFFVISGFLVMDSALRASGPIDFFWRRSLRIYPALVVNILIMEASLLIAGQLLGIHYPLRYLINIVIYLSTASLSLGLIVSHIPHIYTFFSGSPNGFFVTYPSGVLWTLTIEMSFYLVVPIIAAVSATNKKALITPLLAIGTAASIYYATFFTREFSHRHYVLDVLFPQYFWIFGIGIVVRLFWHRISLAFEGTAIIWLPLYVLVNLAGSDHHFFSIGIDFHNGVSAVTVLRTIFLGCTLLSIAYTGKGISAFLLRGNDFSYGLYLWHMYVVTVLMSLDLTGRWWLWPIVIISSLSIAAASWFIVERPSIRLKSRPPLRRGREHEIAATT